MQRDIDRAQIRIEHMIKNMLKSDEAQYLLFMSKPGSGSTMAANLNDVRAMMIIQELISKHDLDPAAIAYMCDNYNDEQKGGAQCQRLYEEYLKKQTDN